MKIEFYMYLIWKPKTKSPELFGLTLKVKAWIYEVKVRAWEKYYIIFEGGGP